MKKLTRLLGIAVAAAIAVPLAACSAGSSGQAADAGTVNWWTWDQNQAQAYKACIPAFEKKYPKVKVKISQYAVPDYFTKLTADFVGGNAPDAFQNSVQYLDAFAKQGQLEPLDSYIKGSKFDTGKFNVGYNAFTYTDGKQYALPLDWAGSAFYYNEDMLKKAGVTEQQVQNMSWSPDGGGTFDKIVAHLTIDKDGVRGDEAGFDKNNVKTYGIGQMASNDFLGQTTWYQFAAANGWKLADKAWPSAFNYNDPTFKKVQAYLLSLSDRGFAPKFGQFTVADTEQLGSGQVAMVSGGSWSAATFAKLPGLKVGTAPVVAGADGTTRAVESNSNGNMIWSGGKHKQAAWDWVSFMGTEQCQTTAAKVNGSFLPSIPASMDALAASEAKGGVNLDVFVNYGKDKQLQPSLPYKNGVEMGSVLQPLFEAYYQHQKGDSVWSDVNTQAKQILTK